MRCLITGHRGFIGSKLFSKLKELGHDVWGVDIKENKNIFEVTPEELVGTDIVFHLAAEVSVPQSFENPEGNLITNSIGTAHLLECCKNANVRRFIFSSSAAVYGVNSEVPTFENDKVCPSSPYAVGKLASEYLCGMYSEIYKLETICLRYFNVFGEGMAVENQYSAALAIFLKQRNEGKNLTLFGGNQTRDFVYVDDVVAANIAAMDVCDIDEPYIINIGSGRSYSMKELALRISSKIDYLPKRFGEVNNSQADIHKAKRILNWSPKVDVLTWLSNV